MSCLGVWMCGCWVFQNIACWPHNSSYHNVVWKGIILTNSKFKISVKQCRTILSFHSLVTMSGNFFFKPWPILYKKNWHCLHVVVSFDFNILISYTDIRHFLYMLSGIGISFGWWLTSHKDYEGVKLKSLLTFVVRLASKRHVVRSMCYVL